MKEYLTVRMPDNTVWSIATKVIAENRAAYFANEFGYDIERSLNEDTLPLFENYSEEIWGWASNNMNWKNFEGYRFIIENSGIDYDKAWAKMEVDLVN